MGYSVIAIYSNGALLQSHLVTFISLTTISIFWQSIYTYSHPFNNNFWRGALFEKNTVKVSLSGSQLKNGLLEPEFVFDKFFKDFSPSLKLPFADFNASTLCPFADHFYCHWSAAQAVINTD